MLCYDIHKLDTEALFKGYVIRMPHVYILKGNAMFYLVKWNLYVAMLWGFCVQK